VSDDNQKPCSVCYSEEGQLAVGYSSGGENTIIMVMLVVLMMIIIMMMMMAMTDCQ